MPYEAGIEVEAVYHEFDFNGGIIALCCENNCRLNNMIKTVYIIFIFI
jgi:hypothetical protein